jgi:hypothetical protein
MTEVRITFLTSLYAGCIVALHNSRIFAARERMAGLNG